MHGGKRKKETLLSSPSTHPRLPPLLHAPLAAISAHTAFVQPYATRISSPASNLCLSLTATTTLFLFILKTIFSICSGCPCSIPYPSAITALCSVPYQRRETVVGRALSALILSVGHRCLQPPLLAQKPEIGRVRVTAAIAAAAAPATAAATAAGMESEPVSDADLREAQTVKRIEEHLTQIFKRDREPSSATASRAARASQQRPSLQIKLLPAHMTVEGLNLALPYSQENQRLLRTLEQGRVPWDELRRHPELHDLRARAGARCARSRE
jgi:hypothetical protein